MPAATLGFLLFIYRMDGRLILPLVPFYDAATSAESIVARDMIFVYRSLRLVAPGTVRFSGRIVTTFRMLRSPSPAPRNSFWGGCRSFIQFDIHFYCVALVFQRSFPARSQL